MKNRFEVKRVMVWGAVAVTLMGFWNAIARADEKKVDVDNLLKDAKRSQGGTPSGMIWNVEIESLENGKSSKARYSLMAKGENALATATEPAIKRGQVYLKNKEESWFFKPGLKRPMAISAKQKMEGQSSNADMAAIDYDKDYTHALDGEEVMDGVAAWRLKLKAKSDNVAYENITAWISKDKHTILKMEYYAVSGELIKTAYMEYKNTLGSSSGAIPFLSSMKIVSALNSADVTIIKYSGVKEKALADALFHRDNLVK